MPAAWSDKDERQYEHIKASLRKQGRSKEDAERIAAATVNKTRSGEGRTKEDHVSKGGEGSKGGHIIGHTKSGKPVYGPSAAHKHASRPDAPHGSTDHWSHIDTHISAHKDFTPEDHDDAISLHQKEQTKARAAGDRALTTAHTDLIAGHAGASGAQKRMEKRRQAKESNVSKSDDKYTNIFQKSLKRTRGGDDFMAGQNDDPHEGDPTKFVEPVRGVPGAKEIDDIAPLLKGLDFAGPDKGPGEEFPILKSELAALGVDVTGYEDDKVYAITKSQCEALQLDGALEFLSQRKTGALAKSQRSNVVIAPARSVKQQSQQRQEPIRKSVPDVNASNRANAVSPANVPLVMWQNTGLDQALAKSIERQHLLAPDEDGRPNTRRD